MATFFASADRLEKILVYYGNSVEILGYEDERIKGSVNITKVVDTLSYYAGEDITDKDLKGVQNAWFSPNGKIYFVPWHGHDFVALLFGEKISALENSGWIHYSYSSANNRVDRISDRMYDSIAKFADANNMNPACIAREKKTNVHWR